MEKLPTHSRFDDPQTLAQFRESFALKVEDMLTDPKHSKGIINVALGTDHANLPDRIRKGEKKLNIDTWEGDAFTQVLQEYRPISEEDYDILRKIFFVD